MTDKIILTEPIMVWELCEVMPQYEEPQFVCYFLRKEDLDNYIKGTKKTWQYGCGELDKAIEQQILENQEKAKKWDLLNDPEGKAFIQSVINMERENKNMREGLQAHRDALYKEQCLYKGLKLDFEDLAKEDCAIRQKAIKDITNLKEKLEKETIWHDEAEQEIFKWSTRFRLAHEKLSKIEALKGYDGNFIREQIKAIIAENKK